MELLSCVKKRAAPRYFMTTIQWLKLTPMSCKESNAWPSTVGFGFALLVSETLTSILIWKRKLNACNRTTLELPKISREQYFVIVKCNSSISTFSRSKMQNRLRLKTSHLDNANFPLTLMNWLWLSSTGFHSKVSSIYWWNCRKIVRRNTNVLTNHR